MVRDLDETLASQKKMAERLNHDNDTINDNILKNKYNSHLKEIEEWLEHQTNIDVLPLHYKDVLANPLAAAEAIYDFLGIDLDVNNMIAIIDPSLYRQQTENLDKPAHAINIDAETDENLLIERLKQLSYM